MLTIYKASAGSGKTYRLAYEYIKLLLGKRLSDGRYVLNAEGVGGSHRPHARILAITFTNKATAEMKSRILRQLDALTRIPEPGMKDADYAGALMKEYGCSREQLRDAAAKALRSLLNDYGAFNVSTIDAFFQTILRSFAREIDRQGDYRLELDSDTALQQSMSMLFDEINLNPQSAANRDIIRWLGEQANERMLLGRDFNPFNRRSGMYYSIVNNLKGIFNEDFTSREKDMTDYLSDPRRLKTFNKWLVDEIQELALREKEASSTLRARGVHYKGGYLEKLLDKIVLSDMSDPKLYNPVREQKGYITAIENRDMTALFGKAGAPPEEMDAAVSWLETVKACFPLREIYQSIHKNINTLWALFHIYQYINRYRIENNLILISDSNSLLRTIIDGSDTPFIYERTGIALENFLIDEFQDTSRMQWYNLKPLVGNSLGSADSLIIGDEKQSIYRWRGGDPELLAHEVAERDFSRLSTVEGDAPGENTNHRSAHDIVKFNNTLFYALSDLGNGTRVDGYGGVAQALFDKTSSLSAQICINNLTNKAFEVTAREILSPQVIDDMTAAGEFTPKEVAMRAMAETILGQLERGYMQSDIAILCRKREEGTEIAEFINRNYQGKIRLISEESLLLRSSAAVKVIVSVLEIIDRSLDNPAAENGEEGLRAKLESSDLFSNEEEREHTLRNYIMRRRRAALNDSFEYYVSNGCDIPEALMKAVEVSKRVASESGEPLPAGDIERDLAEIRRLAPANLSALVQAIIKVKLSPDDCAAELPYITAFVDMVDEFMQNYTPSVHSFLAYWSDNKHKLAISPGTRDNAVTISTVHKAKGLEWPCVHIPLMNWDLESSPGEGWFATDEMECPEGVEAPPLLYLSPSPAYAAPVSPFRRQYTAQCEFERVDNLNVAYVAFTRAVRELHVNLISKGKNDANGTVAEKILTILSAPPVFDSSLEIYLDMRPYIRKENSFSLGEPTYPVEKHETRETDSYPAPAFNVSFDSLSRRFVSLADLTDPYDPSVDDADLGNEAARDIVDRPVNKAMEQAALRGIMLHSILSEMYSVDDFDRAVDAHAAKCTAEELAAYRDDLDKAFSAGADYVTRWFSSLNPQVLTEQAIYNGHDDTVTRADRIVWLPDGSVEVVDYKFTTAEHRAHHTQVRQYADALRRMGYERVSAFLWYPLQGKVVEVR